MPPNFTGRAAELKMLDDWLADNKDRLFILRALGGFGKSALAWQWINRHVNPAEWTKLIWWSFYEGDASFEHFIEETLKYLKFEVPQGQRPQVDELLKAMQGQKILPPDSSRRKTARRIHVRLSRRRTNHYAKADAVEFFRKQKIKGTHAEIEAACAQYGYHPPSLRLLAGRILKDFENPADIVVAQKLKIDGDIIQQKHHVLEISYNSLPPHEQKLLGTIACFRSPVELNVLHSIGDHKETLNDDLHDLVARGLLHFDEKNKKFDLHPIVRRFAYDRLITPERTGVHVILVVYFEAVPHPQRIGKLEDLASVIELYHHMVRAGELDKARELFADRLVHMLYFRFGAYQIIIELLRTLFLKGESYPPSLKEINVQSWTVDILASSYSLNGQSKNAIPLYMAGTKFDEELDDQKNLATGLGNVADDQMKIGALREAEHNFQRSLELSQAGGHESQEGYCRFQLAYLFSYCGIWGNAEQELNIAQDIFESTEHLQGLGTSYAYRAMCFLLMERENPQSKISKLELTIECAGRALEFADQDTKENYTHPVDYTRAYWLLGSAYRAAADLNKAEENLSKAISLCRQINMVYFEANILLDLARLRYDQKNYDEAKSLAEEALFITECCGYVLQGADVNLFLAQYALEQEKDKVKAKEYAETALNLAYCDGPPYYYKVAYHEAEQMLERLKAKG